MATIFFGFLILVLAFFVVRVLLPQVLEGGRGYPYTKDLLFSPAERSFLGVLDQVVGEKYRVLGKVRLADIIKVSSELNQAERVIAFNQIQSKHVDFVFCDPMDMDVKLVVELDDVSHNSTHRQSRDAFVDKALDAAGIKVVRIKARKSYNLDQVRVELFGMNLEDRSIKV